MVLDIPQEWTLEIHHIDVGGGDATAIVVKDRADKNTIKSKVLIDAGAEGGGAASLEKYINNHLEPGEPFDYIIASHYHNDHIDGFRKISFKKYLDVGGYAVGTDKFISQNGTGFTRSPAYFTGYRKHVSENITKNNAMREIIPFIEQGFSGKPEPFVIELGGKITGIRLTCYCANGILADGTNVLASQKEKQGRKFNPNDLSLVFILEWEGFLYFTAGDLSGDTTLQSYYNVEGRLVKYLIELKKVPITVLKVNHHGSEHSTYPGFLNDLQPDSLVIPCNISKSVPSLGLLQRAGDYCTNNKASVVFVNDLLYKKSDDRYKQVQSMKNALGPDCNIEELNDINGTAFNDAQAIIIRRHSGGKKDDGMIVDSDMHISRKGYTIISKKNKFLREGGASQGRSEKYEFGTTFLAIMLDAFITPGFKAQAKAIAGWIQEDTATGKKDGSDYVTKNFPALMTVIKENAGDQLANALEQVMLELFNDTFRMQIIGTDQYYSPDKPQSADNELSVDDQVTIYLLLKNNKYQPELNYYSNNSNLNYTEQNLQYYRDNSWNSDENEAEPYQTGGVKRLAAIVPTGRKKHKKVE